MIKKAELEDAAALAALAIQIWPDHTPGELTEAFRATIGNAEAACFLKYVNGEPVGFAECNLRHDYVEGTNTSPVGYLEGIFVAEEYRRKGYAALLLSACEAWAEEKGCTQFASDCEPDNAESLRFHLAAGFEEANRIVCFKKDLQE